MDEVGFIGDEAVATRIGQSIATVWRKARKGELPQPVRIGRRTLWRSDEITAWIEDETAAYRSGLRPERSAKRPPKGGRKAAPPPDGEATS